MNPLDQAFADVRKEVEKAVDRYEPMRSAHEGHSILREEVEELWEHVKRRQGWRSIDEMRHEAVQVAAMAIRFIHDICDGGRGQL